MACTVLGNLSNTTVAAPPANAGMANSILMALHQCNPSSFIASTGMNNLFVFVHVNLIRACTQYTPPTGVRFHIIDVIFEVGSKKEVVNVSSRPM